MVEPWLVFRGKPQPVRIRHSRQRASQVVTETGPQPAAEGTRTEPAPAWQGEDAGKARQGSRIQGVEMQGTSPEHHNWSASQEPGWDVRDRLYHAGPRCQRGQICSALRNTRVFPQHCHLTSWVTKQRLPESLFPLLKLRVAASQGY